MDKAQISWLKEIVNIKKNFAGDFKSHSLLDFADIYHYHRSSSIMKCIRRKEIRLIISVMEVRATQHISNNI